MVPVRCILCAIYSAIILYKCSCNVSSAEVTGSISIESINVKYCMYKCSDCCVLCPGPLDGGVEEEEEECISDGNELTAKEEFSVEENFAADFETDNLTCEDMEYFCGKGQHF